MLEKREKNKREIFIIDETKESQNIQNMNIKRKIVYYILKHQKDIKIILLYCQYMTRTVMGRK